LAGRTESHRPLLRYAINVALWHGAVGMQAVLFSWLVVGVLEAPAAQVGLVQMAYLAPALLLLLVGGTVADRVDRRRLLIAAQAAVAGTVAVLASLVSSDALSLPLLVVYAIAVGSLTAFVIPARDAILSDVAPDNLMRGATALTLAQYGAQALGALAAASAQFVGVGSALGLQSALVAGATLTAWRLPRSRPAPAGSRARIDLAEVAAGLHEVFRSPVLRAPILLMSGVGLFLAGAYATLMPIVVRDHFHGDVAQLSLFMTVLQTGVVVGAVVLLVSGGVRRRGAVLAFALGISALPLLLIGSGVDFEVTLAAAAVWGLSVAAFQSTGRAIVQEAAPAANRGRVLSVLTLVMMGGGVLGQPVSGVLAGWLGPLETLFLYGAALLVFVVIVSSTTRVVRLD